MQQSKHTIEQPGATNPPSEPSRDQKRKPYVKPAIVYLAPLEAMAGVCEPLGGGKEGGICIVANS
jgi:hypothetical protein